MLGRLLGFEARDVLAFGDSYNDADMLAWAGTGVAMAGAPPEVIMAADDCLRVGGGGRVRPLPDAAALVSRQAARELTLREAQQRSAPGAE